MTTRCTIIAEIGVNHDGSLEKAFKLVDAAKQAGADIAKFQTWKTENLITVNTDLANYQSKQGAKAHTQFELLKSLELSYEEFVRLKDYCDSKNIEFLSTPDDFESASFLSQIQNKFKIGSGELNNLAYIEYLANFQKPIIMSTGMGTLEEVKTAVAALKNSGLSNEDLTLLHTTTQYPAPFVTINLNVMNTLRSNFEGIDVGYSDHTQGIEVAIAAVAMGATVIEKHFTLDTSAMGPDHSASTEPHSFKEMVECIRNVELALGDVNKTPTKEELLNARVVRKKIVAACSINKGEVFTKENLALKRSNVGLDADLFKSILGKIAQKTFNKDEPIL